MSPERDSYLRLEDVLVASARITELVSRGRDECEGDWVLRDALIYELAVIGEACSAVPTDVRESYAHVPWRDVIAMRNVLVHGYFSVAFDDVWTTALEDVPTLAIQLKSILDEWRS